MSPPVLVLPPLRRPQTVPGLGCLGDVSLFLGQRQRWGGGLGVFVPPVVRLKVCSPHLTQTELKILSNKELLTQEDSSDWGGGLRHSRS